jgi:hypothetical protein
MRARRLICSAVAAALLLLAASLAPTAAAPAQGRATSAARATAASVMATAAAEYGVHVASTDGWYTATTLTVVGEISNDTDLPARNVTVRATASTPAGTVATGVKGVWLDIVDPGETASFRVDVDLPRSFDTYRVDIEDWDYTFLAANHYFSGTASATAVDAGTTHVSGAMKNENVDPAGDNVAVATLYAADGTVVGSGVTTLSGTLAPGASAPYSLDVEHAIASTPATVTVVVESASDPNTGVTLVATPHDLAYGSKVALTGTAQPAASVTFERYDQPTTSWVRTGAAVSAGADGSFSTVFTPTYGTSYRAVSGGIPSALALIYLRTAVTMRTSTKSTTVGRKVTLSGTIKPAGISTRVTIERKVGSAWKTLATGAISGSGAFKVAWTPKAKGSYVLRAWVGGGGDLYPGTSSSITIVVK